MAPFIMHDILFIYSCWNDLTDGASYANKFKNKNLSRRSSRHNSLSVSKYSQAKLSNNLLDWYRIKWNLIIFGNPYITHINNLNHADFAKCHSAAAKLMVQNLFIKILGEEHKQDRTLLRLFAKLVIETN